MHGMIGLLGGQYSKDYRKQFGWTEKTGLELNKAALQWHKGGRQSDFEAKPEGWLSRDEMTSQISDLNKRYDSLKIDYDKMSQQRAPTVQQSNPNWRDVHGGYGSQDTNVDNVKIAAKKKTSSTPQQAQTYTGSASL